MRITCVFNANSTRTNKRSVVYICVCHNEGYGKDDALIS